MNDSERWRRAWRQPLYLVLVFVTVFAAWTMSDFAAALADLYVSGWWLR